MSIGGIDQMVTTRLQNKTFRQEIGSKRQRTIKDNKNVVVDHSRISWSEESYADGTRDVDIDYRPKPRQKSRKRTPQNRPVELKSSTSMTKPLLSLARYATALQSLTEIQP